MGGLHVNTEFWSFAGRNPDNDKNEPFLKWLYTLGNTSDAPYVISTSYGEDEDSMTIEYQHRCDTEFQKAGVRGISLLFASGDSGVGGSFKCSDQCDGHAQGKKCLQAQWPAASPYVTAVGGTGGLGGTGRLRVCQVAVFHIVGRHLIGRRKLWPSSWPALMRRSQIILCTPKLDVDSLMSLHRPLITWSLSMACRVQLLEPPVPRQHLEASCLWSMTSD